jgi:uncharacterized protein involved in outer membrane biogenesis
MDPNELADDPRPAPVQRGARRRWAWVLGGVLAAIVAVVGICEALGWPFLAPPVQRWLAQTLDRKVQLAADGGPEPRVKIRLLGSLRIQAPYIEIGAPAWSKAPHMLRARDAYLKLGYGDLWRAHRGEPLRIRALQAASVDGNVERLADGRASWQFGPRPVVTAEPNFHAPLFDQLRIRSGVLALRDDVLGTQVDARFSLTDRSVPAGMSAAPGAVSSAASGAAAGAGPNAAEFRFDANGQFRRQPLKIEFASKGVLTVVAEDAARIAWPITMTATIGRAVLTFQGTATDALKLTALRGRFDVHGPSLAAVGDPLGVTLPTTGAFHASGLVAKQGEVWSTFVERAIVGSSDLSGSFRFDATRRIPLLSGRLHSTRLLLADLGPAVGTAPKDTTGKAPAPAAVAASASASAPAPAPASKKAKQAGKPPSTPTRGPDKVLPDRPFDLPSLRAMDANVLVDVDNLDPGSDIIEPLRPLRTHLLLENAVLTLRDLDARTGAGSLKGMVQLDGRDSLAQWNADLRWSDVRLERWLHQARKEGDAPPYVTGRLNGQAKVAGQGKSTAAILGSLGGSVRMQLRDASISHLLIEAAGLDVAQALGVMIKGDDALPVDCAVADLAAEHGVLRPRVLVLDTRDSTVWSEGSLSLANEALDLRLLVSPKDFSPLALRTPVHLRGSFANPAISIEKAPLAGRVGAAALLALLNPLAAVIPFFDTGSNDDAQRGAQTCQALTARLNARTSARR